MDHLPDEVRAPARNGEHFALSCWKFIGCFYILVSFRCSGVDSLFNSSNHVVLLLFSTSIDGNASSH